MFCIRKKKWSFFDQININELADPIRSLETLSFKFKTKTALKNVSNLLSIDQ